MEYTPEEVITEIDKMEEEFVKLFVERVKLKTPVRTGALRDAWQGETVKGAFEFTNDKDYAAAIEFGTEYIAPVGMVTSTLPETEQLLTEARNRTKLKD